MTSVLVLLALWVLALLPILALCRAAHRGDVLMERAFRSRPLGEGVTHRKNVALRGTAARGLVWSERK
jgi:hypothetical protein